MTAAAWSPGWNTRVELGPGQDRVRRELAGSIRHPSRSWHDAPRMRAYDRSPGTAHRLLHRLAELGVVALQTTLGAHGGTRFTFGVDFWHRGPVRRGMLRRFTSDVAPGQQTFLPPELDDDDPAPGPAPAPPAPQADPFAITHVEPGDRRPSFGELMARHGFDLAALLPRDDERQRWRR